MLMNLEYIAEKLFIINTKKNFKYLEKGVLVFCVSGHALLPDKLQFLVTLALINCLRVF